MVQARTGVQLDTRFSIRYLLAARPLSAATLFYFASVGAFSYFMKVCERPLCYIDWTAEAPANWCADVVSPARAPMQRRPKLRDR